MRIRLAAVAALWGAALVCACGSSDDETGRTSAGGHAGAAGDAASLGGTAGDSGTDASGGSTTGGSSTGGVAGAAGAGGAPTDGAATDGEADGPVLGDAGWFDCAGCACNGATHYCVTWAGGIQPPKPGPDANVCVDNDGGPMASGCKPLPANCTSPPSCGCLPDPGYPACWCNASDGGLHVSCSAP